MDPNANLKEQREILKVVTQMRLAGEVYDVDYVDLLERLSDLGEAMDEWLSKGGFKPTAWK